jgi:hypothetical protein
MGSECSSQGKIAQTKTSGSNLTLREMHGNLTKKLLE